MEANKTKFIQFSISPAEKRRIDEYCSKAAINKSAWIRKLIMQELEFVDS